MALKLVVDPPSALDELRQRLELDAENFTYWLEFFKVATTVPDLFHRHAFPLFDLQPMFGLHSS